MPFAPPRPCPHPGCRELIVGKQRGCTAHAKQRERYRGNSAQRGYTWRWRQAAKAFLRQHPLCECDECQAGKRRVREATVVDHKTPHRGDQELFWDRGNWQAMAKECHDRKTGRGA